jgi:hypothetical protein
MRRSAQSQQGGGGPGAAPRGGPPPPAAAITLTPLKRGVITSGPDQGHRRTHHWASGSPAAWEAIGGRALAHSQQLPLVDLEENSLQGDEKTAQPLLQRRQRTGYIGHGALRGVRLPIEPRLVHSGIGPRPNSLGSPGTTHFLPD